MFVSRYQRLSTETRVDQFLRSLEALRFAPEHSARSYDRDAFRAEQTFCVLCKSLVDRMLIHIHKLAHVNWRLCQRTNCRRVRRAATELRIIFLNFLFNRAFRYNRVLERCRLRTHEILNRRLDIAILNVLRGLRQKNHRLDFRLISVNSGLDKVFETFLEIAAQHLA